GNPDYRQELARTQASLGRLDRSGPQLSQARDAQLNVVALREKLSKEFPDRPAFQQALAFSYNDLALLLHTLNESEKAKEYHLKALAIRKKLADEYPLVASY